MCALKKSSSFYFNLFKILSVMSSVFPPMCTWQKKQSEWQRFITIWRSEFVDRSPEGGNFPFPKSILRKIPPTKYDALYLPGNGRGGMLGMQRGKQEELPQLISKHHQQKTKARRSLRYCFIHRWLQRIFDITTLQTLICWETRLKIPMNLFSLEGRVTQTKNKALQPFPVTLHKSPLSAETSGSTTLTTHTYHTHIWLVAWSGHLCMGMSHSREQWNEFLAALEGAEGVQYRGWGERCGPAVWTWPGPGWDRRKSAARCAALSARRRVMNYPSSSSQGDVNTWSTGAVVPLVFSGGTSWSNVWTHHVESSFPDSRPGVQHFICPLSPSFSPVARETAGLIKGSERWSSLQQLGFYFRRTGHDSQ